jgi:hypothetical protein
VRVAKPPGEPVEARSLEQRVRVAKPPPRAASPGGARPSEQGVRVAKPPPPREARHEMTNRRGLREAQAHVGQR